MYRMVDLLRYSTQEFLNLYANKPKEYENYLYVKWLPLGIQVWIDHDNQ